jgi:hypothetical protein
MNFWGLLGPTSCSKKKKKNVILDPLVAGGELMIQSDVSGFLDWLGEYRARSAQITSAKMHKFTENEMISCPGDCTCVLCG